VPGLVHGIWTVATGGSRQRNTGEGCVILCLGAKKPGSQQKGIEIENRNGFSVIFSGPAWWGM
jgi:hypothetical protein